MIQPFVLINTPTHITSLLTVPAMKTLILCFFVPRMLSAERRISIQKVTFERGMLVETTASRELI